MYVNIGLYFRCIQPFVKGYKMIYRFLHEEIVFGNKAPVG